MTDVDLIQRKVVRTLVGAQILGGIGLGATVSVGALLAADVSGSPAWSGMAATMSTLGAALLAVPLARAAQARGRRVALAGGSILAALGALLAVGAAALGNFPLLLLALGDVARAKGMTQVARDAGLGRESLYKALAPGAKPRFETVMRVVRALGVKFTVQAA